MRIELGNRVIVRPPRRYNRLLARYGGKAPNGLPNFRLVWGWSRLELIGGVHTVDTGVLDPRTGVPVDTLRVLPLQWAPRYWGGYEAWYVEMWTPPAVYGSPVDWHRFSREVVPAGCENAAEGSLVECCGPYPHRGEYELLVRLNAHPGHPLPRWAFELLLRQIQQIRWMTPYRRRQLSALAAEKEKTSDRKAFSEYFDRKWDEIEGDTAFQGRKFVSVPGALSPGGKEEIN